MSFRASLPRICDRFGLLDIAGSLTSSLSPESLTILMYHRISVPGADPLEDPRVISTTPDEFDDQMSWISRNFDLISFRDLANHEDRSARLPKRALLITFDDGYLDNYLHAFPVLKSRQIPATIFLVTGLVGSDRSFWWEEVSRILRFGGHTGEEVRQTVEGLKKLPDSERRTRILEMTQKNPAVPPAGRMLVNWDEVREMEENGVEFGGHSVTHPILSQLTPDALKAEAEGCYRALAERAKTKPLAFAYPVGRPFALNGKVTDAVRDAGFRYAVTTSWGRNRIGSDPSLLFKRIGVGLEDRMPRFKAKLLAPSWFRSNI